MSPFFHVETANLVRIARAPTPHRRKTNGRKGIVRRHRGVQSRVLRRSVFLVLASRRRDARSRMPIFFRSVYAHMAHGRIVTVRNDADDVVGRRRVVDDRRLPAADQGAAAARCRRRCAPSIDDPESLRRQSYTWRRWPRAPQGPPVVPHGALRRSVGAAQRRRHDAARARLRPGRRRGRRQSPRDAARRQRRLLPTIRLRTH